MVRLPNGSLWIVDHKTGKGIYAKRAHQLMAYAMADVVGADGVVNERLTELLHEVTHGRPPSLGHGLGVLCARAGPLDLDRLPETARVRHLDRVPWLG